MSATPLSLSSHIKLNNGISMPRIHLGVYRTSGRETEAAVLWALEAGYRAIDSAQWYANEREVGTAVWAFLESKDNTQGLGRGDIWFTTKLKTNTGYDATRRAIKKSIRESGLEYLDSYLLHSPYGGKDKRLECWATMEDAVRDGEVGSAGVSNYGVKHVSIVPLDR
jgi:diketogulonate reductase-like aldo/keto reductase